MTMPDQPSDMGGMNMKMTLPPMPAIYAGAAGQARRAAVRGARRSHPQITTANPKTQAYFDQGVRLLFGFNHAEAIRSFREAARLDPDCAMCWWGVAFALGPNINLPMQPDAVAPAWDALQNGARARTQGLAGRSRVDRGAGRRAMRQTPPADRHPLDEAFAAGDGQALGRTIRTISTPASSTPRR